MIVKINDKNKKVHCDGCGIILRKRNLWISRYCLKCFREMRDAKFQDKVKIIKDLPKPKIQPIKFKLPEIKNKTMLEAKEKIVNKMITPIKKCEEEMLYRSFKKQGYGDVDIKNRIERLKINVVTNHIKAKKKVKEFY